jgi:hypothetical protein
MFEQNQSMDQVCVFELLVREHLPSEVYVGRKKFRTQRAILSNDEGSLYTMTNEDMIPCPVGVLHMSSYKELQDWVAEINASCQRLAEMHIEMCRMNEMAKLVNNAFPDQVWIVEREIEMQPSKVARTRSLNKWLESMIKSSDRTLLGRSYEVQKTLRNLGLMPQTQSLTELQVDELTSTLNNLVSTQADWTALLDADAAKRDVPLYCSLNTATMLHQETNIPLPCCYAYLHAKQQAKKQRRAMKLRWIGSDKPLQVSISGKEVRLYFQGAEVLVLTDSKVTAVTDKVAIL